jgi:NADH-quinone oxidoreductase subunit D
VRSSDSRRATATARSRRLSGWPGVFVSSRGEKTPWRLRLRTPSFSNISALEPLLVGIEVDALKATLASMGYVVGDIDK